MARKSTERARKKHTYRYPLDAELANIYRFLSKLDLGPFRFYFDNENDALYLQVRSLDTKFYDSVAKIDRDGNLTTTGTMTASTAIESPGR